MLNSPKILIVGAGTAGSDLARDCKRLNLNVVGHLDDYVTTPNVLGKFADLENIIQEFEIDVVYLAAPSLPDQIRQEISSSSTSLGVKFATIPATQEVLSGKKVTIDDLRDIDVLTLVGRSRGAINVHEGLGFFKDKRILITGAAGSIGSELVGQLLLGSAQSIIAVDFSEPEIFKLEERYQVEKKLITEIADIKDHGLLQALFEKHKPHVVLHAAAYKHVPLMERHPLVAVKNNVLGTFNVLDVASTTGVETFVLVSTDKAVNPENVMGCTKRVSEKLATSFSSTSSMQINVVRFGNVIQSQGSVMEIFRRQISLGIPLTVTSSEVTRYFMTAEEACHLILQTPTLARSGQTLVLDMGEPIRIQELVQNLVNALNYEPGFRIIGLRPGEKLHEELTYLESGKLPTENSKIFIVEQQNENAQENLDNIKGFLISEDLSDLSCREFLSSFDYR